MSDDNGASIIGARVQPSAAIGATVVFMFRLLSAIYMAMSEMHVRGGCGHRLVGMRFQSLGKWTARRSK